MEPFERVCRVAILRLSLVAGLLLPIGAAAATVKGEIRKEVVVRCEMGETIGRALAKLDKASPSTVRVSGTCQENVLVRGFEDLMIVGNVGATLVAVPFDPVPSPPDSTFALEVLAARTVAIEGLTIRVTDGRPAMIFAACQDCHVKNVTVDGGIGFYAFDWTSVFFSRLKVTGAAGGAWTAAGAWKASLWIEDSVFEDTGLSSNEVRWCGLCVGQGTVVNVLRSAFRNFGVGLGADTSASVFMQEAVTIEDNWCYGAQGTTGAHLTIGQGSKVLNNSNICWSGGINLDSGATLGISGNTGTGQVLVSGNTGGGIRLNHHAFAQIGSGTVISTNNGPGVEVRNLSIAVGPGPANPPDPTQNAVITGNQDRDLACDSISHINNRAQITANQVQCVNAWPGDGPP